jgi:hypothetical protein
MNLVINVDANDKAAAAVNSVSDRTPVDDLRDLVLGNQEPLTIAFCDESGATPAWVTDVTTQVIVGLGQPGIDGSQDYALSAPLTISSSTRVGTLSLVSVALQNALFKFCACGRPGGWLVMEIRKTDSGGNLETLAMLNVYVLWRVMSNSPTSPT